MSRHPSLPHVAAVITVSLGLATTGCGRSDGDATPADIRPSGSTSDTQTSPTSAGATDPRHLVETASPTPLTPGPYQFSVLTRPGVKAPDAVVDVPRGFDGGATWYVVSHAGNAFLGLYTVERVQRDACLRPPAYLTPGSSVQDLADALVAQKSTRASEPRPVSLDGYRGLYVDLTSPHDLGTCDQPGLWDGRGIYSDDQVDRLWILDVDGQRLVVDASHGPKATDSEIDGLTTMVTSVEFVAAAPE